MKIIVDPNPSSKLLIRFGRKIWTERLNKRNMGGPESYYILWVHIHYSVREFLELVFSRLILGNRVRGF